MDDAQRAAGVHHGVVPGGYCLAVLALGRVPRRGDVDLGAVEDGERLKVGAYGFPHRIGAGDMAAQDGAAVGGGFEDQRHVVGVQPGFAHGHQRGQRMLAHQRVQGLRPRFSEVGGAVHQKPRKLVNPSTGSRSVTSLFSGAFGSA